MSRNRNKTLRLTIWAMALPLALGGCGKPPLIKDPKDVAWYQRIDARPDPVAIVDTSETDIEFRIDWLGKGKSTGQGIGQKMDDWRCGDYGEAQAAAWVGLVCMIAAVPVGAIQGASQGVPGDTFNDEFDEIELLLDGKRLSGALTREAHNYASNARLAVFLQQPEPAAMHRRLEISIRNVRVDGTALPELAFGIRISGKARLLDGDETVHKFRFSYSSGEPAQFDQWKDDDYAQLNDYVRSATRKMAQNIVDEALLVWHSPAGFVRVASPSFVLSDHDSINSGPGTIRVIRDQVSWEAFPRTWDIEGLPTASRITEVSYRTRFYSVASGTDYPAPNDFHLVHEQGGINTASFNPDEYLEACTDYVWTVRAEFLLDGQPRVTEWSGAYDQEYRQFRPWEYRRAKGNHAGPSRYFYDYRTRCTA